MKAAILMQDSKFLNNLMAYVLDVKLQVLLLKIEIFLSMRLIEEFLYYFYGKTLVYYAAPKIFQPIE